MPKPDELFPDDDLLATVLEENEALKEELNVLRLKCESYERILDVELSDDADSDA